ncbi:MAG: carbohydrate ABC transporter permease [Ruminococcus sp.]|nr:carbohydrate ABC transporter permease [Ruminococcus sp.]
MENVGVSKNYMLIQRIKSIGCMIVCILLAAVCLVPLWIMICNATHDRFHLSTNPINLIPGGDFGVNFYNISKGDMAQFPDFNVWTGYINSLIIAGCSTILTVFFSALTSYGLTVYNFKVRDTAYTIILAVMMIPVQVTSTGFVQFMVGTLGLANSYIPLILPAIAAPAVVFYMRQYMKSSFPLDIVEAARIDGCGEFRTFISIAIPMCKPAIAVQAIFAFVANWNNYYTQNMIILSNTKRYTMPIMIQNVLGQDKHPDAGAQYAAVALSIIPIVIIYLCLSKFIVGGVALGGVKE